MTPPVVALNRYLKFNRPRQGDAVLLGQLNPEPRRLPLRLIRSPAAQAGFPSPAADYIEEVLDLNDLLVRNPPSTYLVRIASESMIDERIFPGDYAVVDRSEIAVPGKIVVAVVDGDFYIKLLGIFDGRPALLSRNAAKADQYRPIFLDSAHDYEIFGCVTGTIRKVGSGSASGPGRRQ